MSGQKDRQIFVKRAQSRLGTINANGLGAFLRQRHPLKTAQMVEAETGLPAASIRKWLSGEALPGCEATLRLLLVYGLDLAAACITGCEWLDRAIPAARYAALCAERDRVAALLKSYETKELR